MTDHQYPSRELAEFVQRSMLAYADEVSLNRAIPDYRDGLKPVQRIVMWQMRQSKLWPNAKHMKLAKLSGLCMTYHPHADGSISDSAMALSREWSRRVPLVDIQGNNGSIDGSRGAAPRYVEARMTQPAQMLLESLDEDAVDLIDNYDSTEKIATVLPARIPLCMINGARGLAYGAATSILPHNPGELLKLVKLCLQGKLSVENARKVYNGPDFPTGGKILGAFQQELTSHKATYHLVGNAEVKDGKVIHITSVPYDVNTSDLVDSLVKTLEAHRIMSVSDILDNSGGSNVDITITFKRGTPLEVIESTRVVLEHYSMLSSKVSASNVVVADGKLKNVTLLQYIQMFTRFRMGTMQRVWHHRYVSARDSLELVEASIKAIHNIEHVKNAIEQSKSRDELTSLLMSGPLELTERQARHVASMRLSSLVKAEDRLDELAKSKTELEQTMEYNGHCLRDDEYARAELVKEIDDLIEKFDASYPRLTTVGHEQSSITLNKAVKAAETTEKMAVAFKRGGIDIKVGKSLPEDPEWITIQCNSDDVIVAFTSQGRLIRMRARDFTNDRANRVYKNFTSADEFIHACKYDPGLVIVPVSRCAYVKHGSITDCLPRTLTTRNSRIAHTYMGLKDHDSVAFLWVDIEQPSGITVNVDHNYKHLREQHLDMGVVLARSDKGGSRGARMFNTRDGACKIVSVNAK